jgi:hypothetical protein
MAASLSPSLEQHQKGPATRPALRVLLRGIRGDHELLRWSRLYTGSEADAPHDAAIAPSGNLFRLRNDGGNLRYSSVASPGPGSAFSSWTLLQASIKTGSGVAVSVQGTEGLLVYVRSSQVRFRLGADTGLATWGAEGNVVAENADWLAVAHRPNGDACCVYSVGTAVKRVRRVSGTWGSAATWPHTLGAVDGLAMRYYDGDFHLLVAGRETPVVERRVWGVVLGDGNLLSADAWGPLSNVVARADAKSAVTYRGPHLANLGATRLLGSFAQREGGSPAFDRCMTSHPQGQAGANARFAEPAPHEAQSSHGLALCASTGYAWATTTSGVWRAPRPTADDDVSANVTRASWRIGQKSARLSLELSGDLGSAGWLFPGAVVEIWVGYGSGTGGAAEYGTVVGFIIDRVRRTYEGGRRVTVVEGSGLWEALTALKQPQTWRVAAAGAMARTQIHGELMARAGYGAANAGGVSAAWTGTASPAFVVAIGDSYGAALARLMEPVTDFAKHQGVQASVIVPASAGQAADWALGGPGEHPVRELELVEGGPAARWVRVEGASGYADVVRVPAVKPWLPVSGFALRVLGLFGIATSSEVVEAAAGVARTEELKEGVGSLVGPLHAGLELWDVVSVTDPVLGLSGALYRAIEVGGEYDRRPGRAARYDSVVTLGVR